MSRELRSRFKYSQARRLCCDLGVATISVAGQAYNFADLETEALQDVTGTKTAWDSELGTGRCVTAALLAPVIAYLRSTAIYLRAHTAWVRMCLCGRPRTIDLA